MTPTETLKHEHQIVLMVLEGAEREARSIGVTGKVDTETIARMVDFFRNFVDRCHHGKEERHLFTLMAERGFPTQFGPIGVMIEEHELGRAHVRAIAEVLGRVQAQDAAAAAPLKEGLEAFAELLRAHIYKEDNILYPMADQAFSPEDQAALAAAFDKVEAEEMGEGTHERYHQLAHQLAGR